jgi:hypothetical protein
VTATTRGGARPALVGVLVTGLVLAVLFAPQETSTSTNPRLTSHSREPSGARGFYETARRLGWNVVRDEDPRLRPRTPATVYAVLAPQIPLTASETHDLLERVRAGAALFTVVSERSQIADSLGVRFRGRYGSVRTDDDADCAPSRRARAADALRGTIWATGFEIVPPGGSSIGRFLELQGGGRNEPVLAAAAFELGAGRVAVVSDPDLLTNSVFRVCRLEAGAAMMQLLRYVSAHDTGTLLRNTVVFDEFHHGFGRQPSITRVAARFMADTPIGRTLSQLSLAGVVLLLALGSKPAPAAPVAHRPRRSPLEHVRALSLAYSQVSATRTATRLLVRGMRRRLRLTGTGGAVRTLPDADFLAQLRLRFPALVDEIDSVVNALERPVSPDNFIRVGRNLASIERAVSRERS